MGPLYITIRIVFSIIIITYSTPYVNCYVDNKYNNEYYKPGFYILEAVHPLLFSKLCNSENSSVLELPLACIMLRKHPFVTWSTLKNDFSNVFISNNFRNDQCQYYNNKIDCTGDCIVYQPISKDKINYLQHIIKYQSEYMMKQGVSQLDSSLSLANTDKFRYDGKSNTRALSFIELFPGYPDTNPTPEMKMFWGTCINFLFEKCRTHAPFLKSVSKLYKNTNEINVAHVVPDMYARMVDNPIHSLDGFNVYIPNNVSIFINIRNAIDAKVSDTIHFDFIC